MILNRGQPKDIFFRDTLSVSLTARQSDRLDEMRIGLKARLYMMNIYMNSLSLKHTSMI